MNAASAWPQIIDEASVERLIPAIQQAIATSYPACPTPGERVQAGGSDVANALMFIVANVLEGSPGSGTSAGMRRLAEAAGKELHQLMREERQLRIAGEQSSGMIQ